MLSPLFPHILTYLILGETLRAFPLSFSSIDNDYPDFYSHSLPPLTSLFQFFNPGKIKLILHFSLLLRSTGFYFYSPAFEPFFLFVFMAYFSSTFYHFVLSLAYPSLRTILSPQLTGKSTITLTETMVQCTLDLWVINNLQIINQIRSNTRFSILVHRPPTIIFDSFFFNHLQQIHVIKYK